MPQEVLDPYLIFRRKDHWTLLARSQAMDVGRHLKVSKVGLRAFRSVARFVKPTTRFLQLSGHLATRSVVWLRPEQVRRSLQGEALPCNEPLEDGYVLLRLPGGHVLGAGLLLKGTLRLQLPGKEIRADMF